MFDQYPLFDSHLHIIDPRFPLVPHQGFCPSFFTCSDYLQSTKVYQLRGGAVVAGSFQGFAQNYLIHALSELGSSYVGVTQLPASATDEEVLLLHQHGIRALRFNVHRGGSDVLQYLSDMAARVYELVGWHVELYMDARNLDELWPVIKQLPSVSIDHLGLSSAGLPLLRRFVAQGGYVKASGFGRVDRGVKTILRELYAINPHALMFGTDLPSTRAPRSYRHQDYLDVIDVLGEKGANAVFCNNALAFYKIGPTSEV